MMLELGIFNYKQRNSPDGNSLTNPTPTMATTIPNTEDINFDNTLNESESYFDYEVTRSNQWKWATTTELISRNYRKTS